MRGRARLPRAGAVVEQGDWEEPGFWLCREGAAEETHDAGDWEADVRQRGPEGRGAHERLQGRSLAETEKTPRKAVSGGRSGVRLSEPGSGISGRIYIQDPVAHRHPLCYPQACANRAEDHVL